MPEIIRNTLFALAVVGISGVLFGYLLSLASKFFAVKIDERQEKIRACLPGANCGGCGYSGCDAYAKAVNEGAPINLCNAGGQPVADQLAAITAREAG
ncbi:MAG: RnfABCDGE type electron transport complex subunit B, partial [Clostridia bacterium]|nr:RnfABCDGE type electron transport complex subunit B [Clostridia bacterium]